MKSSLSFIFLLFVTSMFGQNALNFDGVDDYITTTTGGPIGPGNRTVECWIRTTASQQSQQVIFDYGVMSPFGSRFTLNLINFGLLRIEVGGNGFNSTQSIADGLWHHVAVTYDHNATNKFSMYIDGQLEVSQNTTVPVNTSGTGLFIGRRNDGVNYFTGDIDELRVWNVVRSQSEIDSFKNVELCTTPPGLIIYFNFNQGTAGGNNSGLTTLNNQVGANNGTLNNFTLSGSNSNWVSGMSLSGAVMGSDTLNVCDSLRSPSGRYLWTSTGVYYDTLQTSSGCDSILMVDLTVDSVDVTVTVSNGIILVASMNAANYQWLNCDSAFVEIPGATSQSFTPSIEGNYAVIVEYNTCVDTSDCFFASPMSIHKHQSSLWNVYPLPLNWGEDLIIDATSEGILQYRLLSYSGKVISKGYLDQNSGKYVLPVRAEPGIYLLYLEAESGTYVYRVPIK
jgi:hypothetical protein